MADMGRPTEYDPDQVREIRLPHFPESLDERFKQMGKDRNEKPIDMVRWIISKELGAKFTTRPPLQIQKKEKKLNRKYRNIRVDEWTEFQVKALYYDMPATEILMELIQLEVLRHEKQRDVLKQYQKVIKPDVSGTVNFTFKLPENKKDAMVLFAQEFSMPVAAVINDVVQQVDKPEYGKLEAFDETKMENICQRRLVGVSKPAWTRFREFCIRKNVNTNRMLISFVEKFILESYEKEGLLNKDSFAKIKKLLS